MVRGMATSNVERARKRLLAWRLIRFGIGATLVLAAALGGVAWGTYVSIASVLPRPDQLDLITPNEGTRVISADGLVLARVAEEYREVVPLEQIPKALQWATVAAEDDTFYQHHGLSPKGIMRAIYQNVRGGRFAQGGSTITQQLARNVYLSRRKTLSRKLQEMTLALQLERRYTKDEILSMYLNQVCYGNGAWGVRVAAETYFDKPLGKLTLAEAALLAGLPKRPAGYSPYDYPERALVRRDYVLNRMHRLGYISADQAERAKEEPLKLAKRRPPRGISDYRAPYFANYVLRQVVDQFGEALVYRGGLQIQTTLNWQMEATAEKVIRQQIARFRGRHVTEGALVALLPGTGAIKAMVGGVNYRRDQFNVVTQAHRQAGSAFKPFVYTTAIDNGWKPESVISDSPVSYGDPPYRWTPKNADGRFRGRIPLRTALKLSVNVVAVKLAHEVGLQRVIDYAHRMGINEELHPYHSLALGIFGVTPLEMASSFGTIATGGVRVEPYSIERVTDSRGNVLYEHSVSAKRVLPPETCDTMKSMLADVINSGTGHAAKLKWYACGKTGTTSDYKDAWFIGFTDDLVAAVWVGNRDNTPMSRIFGATIPAPTWKAFMSEAVPVLRAEVQKASPTPAAAEQPQQEQDRTYTRQICADSGMLARPECPNVKTVTYIEGQPPYPPKEKCNLHGTSAPPPGADKPAPGSIRLSVCAESGMLATENCPHVVNRSFAPDAAPAQPCPIHPASGTAGTNF